MPSFGEYETIGEPLLESRKGGNVATVWKARKTAIGGVATHALKYYVPRRPKADQSSTGQLLEADPRLTYTEGLKRLNKAAAGKGGRSLAYVEKWGLTDEGVWHVSALAPGGALEAIVRKKGGRNDAALRHVVHSLAVGCSALKRETGLSHGNLKTSNVLLGKAGVRLRKVPLLLSDPYPNSLSQFPELSLDDREIVEKTMEGYDLRSIGEIVLGLVEARPIFDRDAPGYPNYNSRVEGVGEGWRLLGKNQTRWLTLCNRLLDPRLTLEKENLEKLEREFRPRTNVLMVVAAILVFCVAGWGLSTLWIKSSQERQRTVQQARDNLRTHLSAANSFLDQFVFDGAATNFEAAAADATKAGDKDQKIAADNGMALARALKAAKQELGKPEHNYPEVLKALHEAEAVSGKVGNTAASQWLAEEKAKSIAGGLQVCSNLLYSATNGLDATLTPNFTTIRASFTEAQNYSFALKESVPQAEAWYKEATNGFASVEQLEQAQRQFGLGDEHLTAAKTMVLDVLGKRSGNGLALELQGKINKKEQERAERQRREGPDAVARVKQRWPRSTWGNPFDRIEEIILADSVQGSRGPDDDYAPPENWVRMSGDIQSKEWRALESQIASSTNKGPTYLQWRKKVSINYAPVEMAKVVSGWGGLRTGLPGLASELKELKTQDADTDKQIKGLTTRFAGVESRISELEKRSRTGGVDQDALTTEGKAILTDFEDIQARKRILATKVAGERAMNAENDRVQAGETALAVAKKSGDFGPVNEILKVNRGKAKFNDLTSRANTEGRTFTNLVVDFEKRVNNGDYSITNDLRFPENLKVNNLRAQAAIESKELENARQIAIGCNFEKLTNAISGELRSKPPFSALLAQGQKEQTALNSLANQTNSTIARSFFANLPEKEKAKECFTNKLNEVLAGLGAQERFQAAMKDGRAALNQGRYFEASQSAELALNSKPGDAGATALKSESLLRLDLQAAQKAFNEGDYTNALTLCGKHSDLEDFGKIAQGANAEKNVLDAANTNLLDCNYSFIEESGGKSYSTKKPFVELLTAAADQRATYKDLEARRQAGDWQGVQAKLGSLSSRLTSKPCFVLFNEWASKEKNRLLQASQQQREVLDTTLQTHLMTLGVKVPKWLNMPGARGIKKRNAGGELSAQEKDYYGNEANRLEDGYKRLQVLDKDRVAGLKALRGVIDNFH